MPGGGAMLEGDKMTPEENPIRLSPIQKMAAARRAEDSKHTFVYWPCPKPHSNYQVRTRGSEGFVIFRCQCSAWMEWSYKPFAQHGG